MTGRAGAGPVRGGYAGASVTTTSSGVGIRIPKRYGAAPIGLGG